MAITCVWCWTLLDFLMNISDCPRLQNRSLDTSCKGQWHACWRKLRSYTIAVLFTVVSFFSSPPERKNIYSFCAYIALTAGHIVFEIDPRPSEIDGDFELARIPPCTIEHHVTLYLVLNILLFVRIPFLMVSNGTPAGPPSTDGSSF